ncbi:hypothetical protein BDP27DRAFT_1365579 [Rhodocollybia butyracea]|uniref:Uncharacterized protein n=1 Tax=Rhodocollybia butyracea TaxID=206335 RepID=A0A9P5PMB7_9AGAR|nr:hypothetical protein BDP27DRAFT_1365579 [Rhodocollybia butyracea]
MRRYVSDIWKEFISVSKDHGLISQELLVGAHAIQWKRKSGIRIRSDAVPLKREKRRKRKEERGRGTMSCVHLNRSTPAGNTRLRVRVDDKMCVHRNRPVREAHQARQSTISQISFGTRISLRHRATLPILRDNHPTMHDTLNAAATALSEITTSFSSGCAAMIHSSSFVADMMEKASFGPIGIRRMGWPSGDDAQSKVWMAKTDRSGSNQLFHTSHLTRAACTNGSTPLIDIDILIPHENPRHILTQEKAKGKDVVKYGWYYFYVLSVTVMCIVVFTGIDSNQPEPLWHAPNCSEHIGFSQVGFLFGTREDRAAWDSERVTRSGVVRVVVRGEDVSLELATASVTAAMEYYLRGSTCIMFKHDSVRGREIILVLAVFAIRVLGRESKLQEQQNDAVRFLP